MEFYDQGIKPNFGSNLRRGRHNDRRPRHVGITAAVRSPQREVKMVPLYLPEEQRTSAAAPSSPPVSTQQRSGVDSRNGAGAQSQRAPLSGQQRGALQQQRTDVNLPSAARPAAQVQQRQDRAAPASGSLNASTSTRSLSSNAQVQQFGRGFNGVDAQSMAAQPPVESAADVAAEMLTQTRSGQVLVEAEVSGPGGRLQMNVLQRKAGDSKRAVSHQ
jgi:hypothetical protein